MFKIDPKVATAIFHLLQEKYPDIGKDFTESAFFFFLNDGLSKSDSNDDEELSEDGLSEEDAVYQLQEGIRALNELGIDNRGALSIIEKLII